MSDWVVDTNVPIVANGRSEVGEQRQPTVACRLSAVGFLTELVTSGTVLLDQDGAIQSEYRSHLRPSGQPGVGDRFYQVVLHSAPERVRRVHLPKRADGEYADFPRSLVGAGFDPSDRKFAALACREDVPVVNATDSDWVNHATLLAAENVAVHHLCGSNRARWFTE